MDCVSVAVVDKFCVRSKQGVQCVKLRQARRYNNWRQSISPVAFVTEKKKPKPILFPLVKWDEWEKNVIVQ